MENVNIVLAANILKYRKKNGLSQEELANKLGVTFQAVSKWELAKSAPDISFLPTMADVFECSIDDLFSYMPKCKREDFNILPGDSVPTNSANPDGTQKLSHAAVMPDVPTGFDSKKDCSCGKNDVNDLVEAITRKVMAELKK